MAGLQEQARWENEIYRIEENDPVHGGENGITNKPTKQLANRTLYLRNQLVLAGQKIVPKTITATSKNTADATGHTHAIAHGNTTQKGIVQTTSDTGLDSEELAFNAKGAKKLAQQIAQNQQGISGLNSSKVDKTAISNSVSSTSQTNVASSQAVKTAYDKGVEAKNAADTAQRTANAKQSPATTLAGYGITDGVMVKGAQNIDLNQLFNQSAVWLVNGANKSTVGFSEKDIYNFGTGLTLASGPSASMLYMPHSRTKPRLYLKSFFNSHSPSPWAEVAMVDDVVRKTGDTMTGILEIDRADSFVRGKRNGVNKWYVGTPNGSTDDIALHNYTYNYGIVIKSDRVETIKPFYVGTNRVPHAGDSYMDLTSSNYGGITIQRPDRNDKMMFESNGDGFAFIRRNRTTNQNHYVVSMPAKSGEVLLDNDLTGAIMHFAMSSAPAGWLKANGAAVSRTTYADLFAKIGTTFGAGDGRTTFNLPDLRGEFIRGWDDGRNVDGGRRFGESQKGSLTTMDLSPNEDGISIHGLSLRKIDGINTPKDAARIAGLDVTNASDVNHFYQMWVGKHGNRYVDSQLATIAISDSGSDVGNGHINGFTRPRNIALLACIKY